MNFVHKNCLNFVTGGVDLKTLLKTAYEKIIMKLKTAGGKIVSTIKKDGNISGDFNNAEQLFIEIRTNIETKGIFVSIKEGICKIFTTIKGKITGVVGTVVSNIKGAGSMGEEIAVTSGTDVKDTLSVREEIIP